MEDDTKHSTEEDVMEGQDQTSPSQAETEVNVDYKDKWMRAQADYANLQKEMAQKRGEWASLSEWHVLEEFIPVYDNFKKAFSGMPESGETKAWENWAKGIEYIKKQFADILKAKGIEEIETVGKSLDLNLHECLSEEVSEEYDEGIIMREVDTGYMKGGKVLKVAKVVVAKK